MHASTEWLDDAPNRAIEERVTVADLRLFVDGQNATLHLRGDESFDHVTISVYPLVEGLTRDWWLLFGGRDRTLSWTRYRTGFIVPDLRMRFDGVAFETSVEQRIYKNPDIRFWAGFSEVMDRQSAEASLDTFINSVIERLDGQHVQGTTAQQRWQRVRDSRADPDEAAFCEAAGALGLDPYAIDAASAAFIEQMAQRFEGETLVEFLAGSVRAERPPLIAWMDRVEARPRSKARLAELRSVADAVAARVPARPNEPGWSLGYRRASAFRAHVNFPSHQRFRGVRDFAHRLGASQSFSTGGPIDGLRALRSDREDGIYIHLRDHGSSPQARASRLFSFARAVGDAVCFPEPSRSAINELSAAVRQSAGRAFASEILAPIDELRSMRDDGKDPVSIADAFGVSTMVIDHQWENRERIDACLVG